jgi:signal peptidase I
MRHKILGYIKEFTLPVLGTVIIFWLLTSVVFQYGIVPSSSMSPTADSGSIIFGNRLAYLFDAPKCGDIIIFTNHEEDDLIVFKRVIGLEGDIIEFKDGLVYRNGIQVKEEYLHDPASSMSNISNISTFEVPEDSVFVLGDNRLNSVDSRSWREPYIKYKDISSKVFLVIPFGKDCETKKVSIL